MGCDIHLHQEVKIDGEWHHYAAPRVDRNYMMFAKMVGVRNYQNIEPIAPIRGIPADATRLTRLDFRRWGEDGHSHSWLSSQEVSELGKWCRELSREDAPRMPQQPLQSWGYLFGDYWDSFHEEPRNGIECLEDFRFVFWFDN